MTEVFKIDSEKEIKRIITQSKQAAIMALQNYDLDWEQIRFNQFSDTSTFIIETSNEGIFLLRIFCVGMSREEIDSELVWLDALNEKMDISLPKGILDRDGAKTIKINLENGYFGYASLMRWVEGVQVSGGLTEDQIFREGILLAKLHQASQNFELSPNFIRPFWGEESFRKAMTRLAQHYDRFLADTEFQLYQLAAERILSWINKLSKDDESYGLIHGDLHQGNIVFHNGEPHPIDFGRCGFGYFLYDIAHTILGLYPWQRELLIKGYESKRRLEGEWLPALESFTVMVMIENYCHHAPDPRETEGLKEEQLYAQAIIKNYLAGAPFLFNEIKI
ncbi:phosphotransferase enzyme family protein [Paenibacillus sp. PL91]|uniref:phosphotransferase enzyme family protein n=1 Tax=Paenibacillus sp. PL91 TaxID=2729538 RepID=UPI00145DCF8C|nr:phosphotransferase [Paenibacillus sp. PL91]MBC9203920.1 phosphotransferase [Paenibacillus sp. PL91]